MMRKTISILRILERIYPNDTAHVKWGKKWRMQTCDELYDLIDECKW